MGFDEFENCSDSMVYASNSVKWFEVPIQKFNDIVPHFVESLKTHQKNIAKLRKLQQWKEEQKEQVSATQIINQLSSLLIEMENLRSQLSSTDLDKFDRSIGNSKQRAKTAIRSFYASASTFNHTNTYRPPKNNFENVKDEDNSSSKEQLEAIADLTETLQIQHQRAVSMEKLHENIEDINYMFQELSKLVHEQGEAVEKIEANVETTLDNVTGGTQMLAQAARYKRAGYPLLGALIGFGLGGPVGLYAGFKVGSLTAVGAGVLGYTGMKIIEET